MIGKTCWFMICKKIGSENGGALIAKEIKGKRIKGEFFIHQKRVNSLFDVWSVTDMRTGQAIGGSFGKRRDAIRSAKSHRAFIGNIRENPHTALVNDGERTYAEAEVIFTNTVAQDFGIEVMKAVTKVLKK